MNRSPYNALLMVSLLLTQLPVYGQADPLEGLDQYIENALVEWRVPGLAVAVVSGDSVIYAKGFGVREVGRPEPVNKHTLFAIASNTKAFTTTALGMLVSQGKLSWDDKATKYLPDFQLHDAWATKELRIRDMLSHKAGYPTWGGDMLWWGSSFSRAEVLYRYRFQEPRDSFRYRYGYNNILFIAAGEMIPVITGRSWDDFITEEFFQPLGMTRSTTHVSDLPARGNVATPHMLEDGQVIPIPYRDQDNLAPAAAINSSVWEVSQWLRLQLRYGAYDGVQIVDSAAIRATRTPHTIKSFSVSSQLLFPTTHFRLYGLGWNLQDYHGGLLVYHTGGMDGMLSASGFLPERDLGVVILTNFDDHRLYWALFWHIVDSFLDARERDWSAYYLEEYLEEAREDQAAKAEREKTGKKKSKPSRALKYYAGVYENNMMGKVTVSRQGKILSLKLESYEEGEATLTHWQNDTFTGDWREPTWLESPVTFTLDDDRKVVSLRFSVVPDFIDPLVYEFNRID
ncbi:MAG: serine hydrolase [Candidatus Neomarinimicrobiota bacterium]